jgi:hypothetical protein
MSVELLGYLASALVVLSLMMGSILRLRIVSLVGSVIFAVYGLLIGSVPVLLTNGAIAVINVVHLVRLWRERRAQSYFEVVPASPSSQVMRRFLDFHAEDITRLQPGFSGVREDLLVWWVLRDAVPVGLIVARETGPGTVHLELDYVADPHRDFQAGSALYRHGVLAERGVQRVTSEPGSEVHRRYLERMGFRLDGELLVRELA